MASSVFLGLGLVIALGASLRFFLPGVDVEAFRKSINTLVLYVLLPALIVDTLARAPLTRDLVAIPVVMSAGIAASLVVAVLTYRVLAVEGRIAGGLMLASSFSNVTYLGLPVLQALFPTLVTQVSEVALLCEVTMTPLNLSLGSAVAHHYGHAGEFNLRSTARSILTLPPIWATVGALACNLLAVPLPAFFMQSCDLLGRTVTGLMVLSLGMALKPAAIRQPLALMPVLVIKLLVFPLVAWSVARALGLAPSYLQALTLEAAMPSQLLSFVIADRFGLDVETLAMAVLATTVVSFFTIPLAARLLGV